MTAASHIEILPNSEALSQRVAEWISEQIADTTDVYRIALSGGETPRLLYLRLASKDYRERIEWRRVELFWGDERFVPPTDERSNYRMVRETLLAKAPVLIDHVHPILTEGDPASAAARYEALLKTVYGSDQLSAEKYLFDLVLLGLGEDGHTASLFPGTAALNEQLQWVTAVRGRQEARITLTFPAIQSSRAIAFLVSGEEKAEMVRSVQGGDQSLPASRVRSDGQVVWFLDRAAASRLDATPTLTKP